jgi:hypothetical protein
VGRLEGQWRAVEAGGQLDGSGRGLQVCGNWRPHAPPSGGCPSQDFILCGPAQARLDGSGRGVRVCSRTGNRRLMPHRARAPPSGGCLCGRGRLSRPVEGGGGRRDHGG